jgi:rare lipoprotein A
MGARPGLGAETEQGLASWYGVPFHRQTSASGEIFDAGAMTAAHRTLPFGTAVRVRRMDSSESVVVRINDRGPFVAARIIDVSEAAARRLGMHAPGVVPVAVEVLERGRAGLRGPSLAVAGAVFAVQAGTFRNLDNARRMRVALAAIYGTARLLVRASAPSLWCVVVGDALSGSDAQALAASIRARRKDNAGAYAIRLDAGGLQFAD